MLGMAKSVGLGGGDVWWGVVTLRAGGRERDWLEFFSYSTRPDIYARLDVCRAVAPATITTHCRAVE
jgi:hypothetical protein